MYELKNSLFDNIQETPMEHYTFEIPSENLRPVEKKFLWKLKKPMLVSIVACLFIILAGIFSGGFVIGLGVASLLINLVSYIKSKLTYKKLYAKRGEEYAHTVFDYTLYKNFLIIWISSPKSIKQLKVELCDIKNASIAGDYVALEIDGLLYLLPKDQLIENSYFSIICKK